MYVAITKQLVSDTRQVINRLRDKERATLPEPDFNGTPEFYAAIDNKYWGNLLHLRSEMPVEWCTPARTVKVRVLTHTETGETLVCSISASPADSPILPPKASTWDTEVSFKLAEVTDPNLRAQLQRVVDIHMFGIKWEKVNTDVSAFLEKCKSLNEALKLWPHIALYIPIPYINKVNEKKGRLDRADRDNDPAAMLKSMDVESLVTAAVTARML